jgi:TM2 domain-containing membrane protein YozV
MDIRVNCMYIVFHIYGRSNTLIYYSRNGVRFTTVIVTSIFVGVFGVDRFCLGYVCCGIIKLFTLGGIGVWWLVDLILLLVGYTYPSDGSSWESVY